MNSDKRFVKVYAQGTINKMEIIVDKETGVNYIRTTGSYSSGITPLLDENGKPVITKL